MARCPSCNKFVSVKQADPEQNGLTIDGVEEVGSEPTVHQVTVEAALRLVVGCADCNEELYDYEDTLELVVELTHTEDCGADSEDLEVDEISLSPEDRYEGKGRWAEHFYGARLDVEVTCGGCKATATAGGLLESQASGMNDLV